MRTPSENLSLVWALAESEFARHRLSDCLAAGFRVCWRDIRSLQSGIRPGAVVIATRSVCSEFGRAAIAEVRGALLQDSAVLVTDLDCENARALRDAWNGEVVWYAELEGRLPATLDHLVSRDVRRRVHDLLAGAVGAKYPEVRRALRCAFLQEDVPTSLAELAEYAGLSVRRFRGACNTAQCTQRAEALVDLALLSHAHASSVGARSLSRFCYERGIQPWRVQRAARRRAGSSFGALGEEEILTAARAFISCPFDSVRQDQLPVCLPVNSGAYLDQGPHSAGTGSRVVPQVTSAAKKFSGSG